MLNITDQNTAIINESQLKTLKNKAVSPIKFIAPPKEILEALQLVISLKSRQEFIISGVKVEIEAPNCANKNSLSLQLSLMQDSRNKLNATLCSITRHLVAHKFKGIEVIGRYAHLNQPHVRNWHEVSINGVKYYLNLTTGKNSNYYDVPYKGIFEPTQILERPNTPKSDLTISEALSICDSYNYKIMKKRANTKDLNKRINTHNRVVKILKMRIQQGLTTLVKSDATTSKSQKKAHRKQPEPC